MFTFFNSTTWNLFPRWGTLRAWDYFQAATTKYLLDASSTPALICFPDGLGWAVAPPCTSLQPCSSGKASSQGVRIRPPQCCRRTPELVYPVQKPSGVKTPLGERTNYSSLIVSPGWEDRTQGKKLIYQTGIVSYRCQNVPRGDFTLEEQQCLLIRLSCETCNSPTKSEKNEKNVSTFPVKKDHPTDSEKGNKW